MECWVFLRMFVIALMSRGFDVVETSAGASRKQCPRPTSSILITVDNMRDADIDATDYTPNSSRLPLVCHYSLFELKYRAFATCVNGEWQRETDKCVAKIWKERERTKRIILIAGLSVGGLAVLFLILRGVQYRWEIRQKKTLDDAERNFVVNSATRGPTNNYSNEMYDYIPEADKRHSRPLMYRPSIEGMPRLDRRANI